MKFKTLALVAMLFSASSAFAADFATDLTGTVDVVGTEAAAAMGGYTLASGAATDPFTGNVALIEQLGGSSEIAVIDQSAGTINFAAISQSGAADAGVAYISQLGTSSFAYIKQ